MRSTIEALTQNVNALIAQKSSIYDYEYIYEYCIPVKPVHSVRVYSTR